MKILCWFFKNSAGSLLKMLSKLFYDFQPAAAVKSDCKNKGKD